MIRKIKPDHIYWFYLAVLVKFLVCFYLYYAKKEHLPTIETFFISSGDTYSYLDCIDNLINEGTYSPFYRMPGVGAPYFLLRQFFEPNLSYTLFTIIQILLDAFACFLLSKLAYQITKNKLFFLFTFILSITNSYYSVFSIWLNSEALCTSSLIISLYYFYQAILIEERKMISFLLSGFFITWAIFCRPIYAPLLILYSVGIVFYLYKNKVRQIAKYVCLFLFPFIIFDALWVYAGYKHTNKIIFLQHSEYTISKEGNEYGEAYIYENWKLSLFKYVQGFGGDIVDWNPESEISWFGTHKEIPSNIQNLPTYAVSKTVTIDSLLDIKNNIKLLYSSKDAFLIDSLRDLLDEKLVRFSSIYKQEKPFQYHIMSRVLTFKKMIIQNPTYNLYNRTFSNLNIFEKGIKVLYLLLYYMYILGAFLSVYFILKEKRLIVFLPIILIAGYGLSIYSFLRFCEFRYIVPIVPFLLILSAYALCSFFSIFISYGKNSVSRP